HRHFFEGRPATEGGAKDLGWVAPHRGELADESWFDTEAKTLGMYVAGDALNLRTPRGEPVVDVSFLLLLHGGGEPVDFTLPGAPWAVGYRSYLDTDDEHPAPSDTTLAPEDTVTLAPRSVVLLEALR